jgi:serine/threonine-protein kinase
MDERGAPIAPKKRPMRAALGLRVYTPSAVSLLGMAAAAAMLLLQLDGGRSPAHWVVTALLGATAVASASRGLWRRRASEDDTTVSARRDSAPSERRGERVGAFLLGEHIGSGGVGDVYRARRTTDGREAAVKIITKARDEVLGSDERFQREVQSLENLRSPHIVEVLDWGRTPDGHEFVAMELLQGPSLANMLHDRGAMPLQEVVRLVADVARGLDAAHRLGIIHRDVKPSNLVLADDVTGATWKLLDFGLSKIYGVHASITRGCTVGTPGFMSPEQALGEPLDARSDVFALAVVAYVALTARPAFVGRHPVDLLYQVLHRQPESPSSITSVPVDVDLVLALGMAKQVGDRPASAVAFAESFAAASRGQLPEDLRHAAVRVLSSQPWQHPEEGDTLVDWSKNRWPSTPGDWGPAPDATLTDPSAGAAKRGV